MAEDRRVRKSKRAIKQAFIQLLTENNKTKLNLLKLNKDKLRLSLTKVQACKVHNSRIQC